MYYSSGLFSSQFDEKQFKLYFKISIRVEIQGSSSLYNHAVKFTFEISQRLDTQLREFLILRKSFWEDLVRLTNSYHKFL